MSAAELPTVSMMGWAEGSASPRQSPALPYGMPLRLSLDPAQRTPRAPRNRRAAALWQTGWSMSDRSVGRRRCSSVRSFSAVASSSVSTGISNGS